MEKEVRSVEAQLTSIPADQLTTCWRPCCTRLTMLLLCCTAFQARMIRYGVGVWGSWSEEEVEADEILD